MRIAYIGIDLLYPALPALWESGCEIAEIFTCKTDNVTEFNLSVCAFARQNGVPLKIGRIDPADIGRLKKNGCEALVCGGYYHRIPVDPDILSVNIHPSLLPVGRGAWPMPVTILRGLSESGVTVHRMTEDFDAGAILLQEPIRIDERENLSTLLDKQRALLPGMMRRLAADFSRLYADAVPQGPGEYWPCPSEADYPLGSGTPAPEADRILRAFYGYELIYHARDKRYGLIGGALRPGAGRFEVAGGYCIEAEKVRELYEC